MVQENRLNSEKNRKILDKSSRVCYNRYVILACTIAGEIQKEVFLTWQS